MNHRSVDEVNSLYCSANPSLSFSQIGDTITVIILILNNLMMYYLHNKLNSRFLSDIIFSLCKHADGYISNTCVDIDYEAVKRKVLQSKKIDISPLPPPPPDPPHMLDTDSSNRDRYSRPIEGKTTQHS